MEIKDQPVPLREDDEGTLRIGATRVSLETVVVTFQQGATAEEIVQQFPTLDLADVYAVISYYLRYRHQVKEYLREREKQAERIRAQVEQTYDSAEIRDRLIARRNQAEE